MTDLKLIDLTRPENRDRAFRFADLKAAGLFKHYKDYLRWVKRGYLREPRRLPNGAIFWLGSDLAPSLRDAFPDQFESGDPETDQIPKAAPTGRVERGPNGEPPNDQRF